MGNAIYEIQRNIKRAVDRSKVRLITEINDEINRGVLVLKREAEIIYDKMLDQFYSYKTTSYYRHDTGKGTGTGMNLYRANDIHIEHTTSNINYTSDASISVDSYNLVINFDPSDMAEYRGKYRDGEEKIQVDREFVFKLVFEEGHRGLPRNGWGQSWEADYNSNLFSYKGKMKDAFDEFEKNKDKMLADICSDNIDKIIGVIVEKLGETILNNLSKFIDILYS